MRSLNLYIFQNYLPKWFSSRKKLQKWHKTTPEKKKSSFQNFRIPINAKYLNITFTNEIVILVEQSSMKSKTCKMRELPIRYIMQGGDQNRAFRFRAVYLLSGGTVLPFLLICSFFLKTHSLPLPFFVIFCFFLGLCLSEMQTCMTKRKKMQKIREPFAT